MTDNNSPATPEQRAALIFAPYPPMKDTAFTGPLGSARLAAHLLTMSRPALRDAAKKMIDDETDIGKAMDGLILHRDSLQAMAEMMETALHRLFLVLEDLGYSPDKPPPN